MDPFDRLTEILSFDGLSSKEKNSPKAIHNQLATFSTKHIEVTRLLAQTLKRLAKKKKELFVQQQVLEEKESDLLGNKNVMWKADNQTQRNALVKTRTKKQKRKVVMLESKVVELETLRSAIYGGLKTLEQGRDSLSRQLSVIELEAKLDS